MVVPPSHSPSLPWAMAHPLEAAFGRLLFCRLGSLEEVLLAAGVVAAAPVGPAVRGALARDHLDDAGGAGGRAEIALRRELEERERLFRRQGADPGDQL